MKLFSTVRLRLRVGVPIALMVLVLTPLVGSAKSAEQQIVTQTAQDHLVTPEDLQTQLQTSTADRQKNVGTLNEFLSSKEATQAMHDARIDPVEVKTAISTLSDAEVASLAARATDAQDRFAAGHLGVGLFTLIILAIVVIIVVSVMH